MFNTIGIAFTFSPTGKDLLREGFRIASNFNAELILIHVGSDDDKTSARIESVINDLAINNAPYRIVCAKGEPADVILNESSKNKLDLLIIGALEKEGIFQYFLGSVARKVIRKAECSLLVIISQKITGKGFRKVFIRIDEYELIDNPIKKAFSFIEAERSNEVFVIKEIEVPGLSITVTDSGSIQETEEFKNRLKNEEMEKLRLFMSENKLTKINSKGRGANIQLLTLYGKRGWEAKNYAESNNADLLIVRSPIRKMRFIDRIFQSDLEFILEELPCSLLIIKS